MSIFKKHAHEQLTVSEFCADRSLTLAPETLGTLGTIATALTKSEHLPTEYERRNGKTCRTYPSHILLAAFRAFEVAKRMK